MADNVYEFRPKAGDSARASFTRLGSVSCRFV